MQYKLAVHYERRLRMTALVVFQVRDQALTAKFGLYMMRRMAMMTRA
jgi:hypothetical protein